MTRRSVARLVASGFFVGFVPAAPGTAGSLAALVAGAALMRLSPWALPVAALAATVAGVWAIAACGARDDPGWVVIDEVAGQWVAMLALPLAASPLLLLAAFALFRLFDIAKPGPVGWADRRHGPVWVMADDLIAGAMAALVLIALQWSGII